MSRPDRVFCRLVAEEGHVRNAAQAGLDDDRVVVDVSSGGGRTIYYRHLRGGGLRAVA